MITKTTMEWDEGRITFEGSEEFVRDQISLFTKKTRKSSVSSEIDEGYTPKSPTEVIAEKRPKGHHEIVAVLAFILAEKGFSEFSEEDIRRMYLQARVRPPKVVGQALRDAKNKFDFLENGEKRGTYRISHHGDRTVRYDLPKHAS